jgi:hypothetical protein
MANIKFKVGDIVKFYINSTTWEICLSKNNLSKFCVYKLFHHYGIGRVVGVEPDKETIEVYYQIKKKNGETVRLSTGIKPLNWWDKIKIWI